MQVSVFVEPIPGIGFRAQGAEPALPCVEGATRDEAIANLKEAVELYFEGESDNAYTPVSEIAVGQETVDA